MFGPADGRAIPPDQTFARLAPHFCRLGITRVADVTGLDRVGIPVAQAIRPQARSLSVSQGKGLTGIASRVSAVMESIESHHAEAHRLEVVQAPAAALRGSARPVDLTRLPLRAVHALRPDDRLAWVRGHDLLASRDAWVPEDAVHVDYTRPADSYVLHCSSNGLAAGNDWEEALASALAEVIERDALALWSLLDADARRSRRLHPSALDDTPIAGWRDRFAQAGLALELFDATSDLGVPVVYARLWETDDARLVLPHPTFGAGCHVDARIALTRAVAEAAQARVVRISGAREDLPPPAAAHPGSGLRRALDRALLGTRFTRSLQDLPSRPTADAGSAVVRMLEQAARAGLDSVIAVDLTQPSFGIPVARVVVPGAGVPLGPRRFRPPDRARGSLQA